MTTSTPPEPPDSGLRTVDPWAEWPLVTWCAYSEPRGLPVRPASTPSSMVVSTASTLLLSVADRVLIAAETRRPGTVRWYASGEPDLLGWLWPYEREVLDLALRVITDPDLARAAEVA